MIRVLLTYIVPLLLPTALYFLWLWLMQRGSGPGAAAAKAAAERPVPWAWLALAGLVLVGATLFAIGLSGGNPPGGVYQPPRVEGGQIVPGHVEP